MVFTYAAQNELQTATLTGLADLQEYLDKFHWKVDSEGMKRLVKYVVELSAQMRSKHAASLMVANEFPWRGRGFYVRGYDSYFQVGVENTMAKRRFMPIE